MDVERFTVDGARGRHEALRGLVEPWFRARAVRTMEPVIRELARELIDEIVARDADELNIASELAYRLSIRVNHLIGAESEREQWLRERLDEVAQLADPIDAPPQWDLQAYLWSLVLERVARPQDELLDVIVSAGREGRVDDRGSLGYLAGFVSAGTNTAGTNAAGTNLVNGFALLTEFGYLDDVRDHVGDKEAKPFKRFPGLVDG